MVYSKKTKEILANLNSGLECRKNQWKKQKKERNVHTLS
jgi:hypothetical protein